MLKYLTISVDSTLIEKARVRAMAEHTTLNEVVRRFLSQFAQADRSAEYDHLMAELAETRSGRTFTRNEANLR